MLNFMFYHPKRRKWITGRVNIRKHKLEHSARLKKEGGNFQPTGTWVCVDGVDQQCFHSGTQKASRSTES